MNSKLYKLIEEHNRARAAFLRAPSPALSTALKQIESSIRYQRRIAPQYYFVEVTDTFGGEANYCWCNRFKVSASTERGAISKVARYSGYKFRSDGGGRYNARGAAVCAFIDMWSDTEHGNLTRVESI